MAQLPAKIVLRTSVHVAVVELLTVRWAFLTGMQRYVQGFQPGLMYLQMDHAELLVGANYDSLFATPGLKPLEQIDLMAEGFGRWAVYRSADVADIEWLGQHNAGERLVATRRDHGWELAYRCYPESGRRGKRTFPLGAMFAEALLGTHHPLRVEQPEWLEQLVGWLEGLHRRLGRTEVRRQWQGLGEEGFKPALETLRTQTVS